MTERGNHEGKRGGLADWLNHPDPFRNQVRCSGVEKIWRKNINFAFAQITDLNGKGHEIILRAILLFAVTAQSTESITPVAPPLFPLMANLVSVMR
jgi:hypothetical protein